MLSLLPSASLAEDVTGHGEEWVRILAPRGCDVET